MSEYLIKEDLLSTEGDVELKLITPLLVNPEPVGLGYSSSDIQSKINLRKLKINKGAKTQSYYPDFILSINGIPVVVIEAKKPNEDLDEAFRQASLYASEINRFFQNNLNPCELIFATDGIKLVAGYWDDAKPKFEIPLQEWVLTNDAFSLFCADFAKSKVEKKANQIRKAIRTDASFKNPLLLLGGKYIQNQSSNNTFGESISINYRHLFNPNEENERADIVKNAYVKVTKHQAHVDPIDKLIRKKIRPAIDESIEVENNVNPKELLGRLKNIHNYNNQVLLLIGSVGSGKSTFSTYLKEVALDNAVVAKTAWVRLDLNEAPVNSTEIYNWVKKNIILQIKGFKDDIDYDDISGITRLYNKEIQNLKKGALSLLDSDNHEYKSILMQKLLSFQEDLSLTLECYIREFVHAFGKELIIILDNCDKRNLEEQLLMFEVANWIKINAKAMVFLPIRDTTFDHFRNEKPLDTVIKDLIFRINPPSLEKVIYNRIKYANRLSDKLSDNYYTLPNGWRVSYPSSDELHYLKSILTSLFQNHFFKRLITGLAGRDVRKGIEVFLDFCKSGHITESEIVKMKQSKGSYKLPNHIIGRVFMRGNRLYYSNEESRVKNLFHSEPSDNLPDPFVRVAILKWLNENKRKRGPSGILGFHKIENLINTMTRFGHSESRVRLDLLFLLKNNLIISESQDTNVLDIEDLISINPPGVVHFELIKNIDYLSSCAENVWFKDVSIAEQISKDMSGQGNYSHLSIQTNSNHAYTLAEYLLNYYNQHFKFHSEYLSEENNNRPYDFETLIEEVDRFKTSLLKHRPSMLADGSKHSALIVSIQSYGIMCEIKGTSQVGLIHSSLLPREYDDIYKLGDPIEVEIIAYAKDHRKYNLRIVEIVEEKV